MIQLNYYELLLGLLSYSEDVFQNLTMEISRDDA